MEFHISRAAREAAKVDDLLFGYSGNVVFANVSASRSSPTRSTKPAGRTPIPAGAFNAGALFAMGLIDELSHALVAKYRKRSTPPSSPKPSAGSPPKPNPPSSTACCLPSPQQFPNVAVFAARSPPPIGCAARPMATQPRGRARRAFDAVDRQHQSRVQALPSRSSKTPASSNRPSIPTSPPPSPASSAPGRRSRNRHPLRRPARANAWRRRTR